MAIKVAQIFNLLYRRFLIDRASDPSSALMVLRPAQNVILRYGRLKICATQTWWTPAGGIPWPPTITAW
jgi:hypothetical protein